MNSYKVDPGAGFHQAGSSGFSPLVSVAHIGIPDAFDQNGTAVVDFFGEAGALSPSDAAYKNGARFLMNTQMEDGSWYVRSRTILFQPYFDAGLPYGPDQFISVAATNWATMALAPAVR